MAFGSMALCTSHLPNPRGTMQIHTYRCDFKAISNIVCTVKYRQSIAYVYIHYIGGHFSEARGEKLNTNRPQKVAQAAVCRRSEHHAVFVGCQHQGCPHYCLGQETGATLTLRNARYRLQHV